MSMKKTFKTLCAIFAAFALAFSCQQISEDPTTSNSDDTLKKEDIPEYLIVDGTTVKGVRNKDIYYAGIPYGITKIGSGAFSGCSSLTSVTIPDSVTSIGDSAFEDCSSLTNVTIPDSVTSIGDSAFEDCSSLTNVTIPDSVTSIGNKAFSYCSSLTRVTIPNSVTSIGIIVFGYCKDLTNVTIGNGVTSIEDSTFSGCSSLTNVTIPDGVTTIGFIAFSGCSSLTNVTIPDSVTSIGSSAFSGCTALTIHYNGMREQWELVEKAGTFNIPVVCIDDEWGSENQPAVLTVKNRTVIKCDPSATGFIEIQPGVTSIGNSAFSGCRGLTSVTIPGGVTSIGGSAFSGCWYLTSVTIPDSVTSIGEEAFMSCSRLTSVTIPDSVTSIGGSAFNGCSSLTSVTIPDSVTYIGGSAFYGCSSLTSVTVDNGNPNYSSQDGILYNKNKTEIIYVLNVINGAVTIPDSVTSIGDYAFYGCSNVETLVIGDGITSLSNLPITSALKSITIGNSVTSIGGSAFDGCSNLTSVTIPDSVTSISDYAFYNCSSLTSVTVDNGNPNYSSQDGILYNKNKTKIIYVLKAINGAVTIPDSVTYIDYGAFFDCTALATIEFAGTVEQWKNITKGDGWHNSVPATKVVCSDGEVTL